MTTAQTGDPHPEPSLGGALAMIKPFGIKAPSDLGEKLNLGQGRYPQKT